MYQPDPGYHHYLYQLLQHTVGYHSETESIVMIQVISFQFLPAKSR